MIQRLPAAFALAALAVTLVVLVVPRLDGPRSPVSSTVSTPPPDTAALAALGSALFHDPALSSTGTQSCATCHAASHAFTDPRQAVPVSEGAVAGRFGTRNSPTLTYAAFVPPLAAAGEDGETLWTGGLFWDGRADTLEDQAPGPLMHPAEMDNGDAAALADRLRGSSSRALFESVFGAGSLAVGADPQQVLGQVAQALGAFQRTGAFAPFTSKYDAFLAGRAELTAQEQAGLAVFEREDKGNCAACHPHTPGPQGEPPLFTDFTYDNLGLPRHPDRRYFAADFVDTGLEQTLLARGVDPAEAAALRGAFRVPTLRNITRTAPYMHNGVFADLRTAVEFYNDRDSNPQRWAAFGPVEVPETVNREELGDLKLTTGEIDALMAFLATLDDGWQPGI